MTPPCPRGEVQKTPTRAITILFHKETKIPGYRWELKRVVFLFSFFFFFLNKFLPSFSLLMRPSQVPLLKRAVIAFSALTLHLPIIYALAVSCNNNNYNIKFHSQIKHDHAAVRLPNAEKHASHTLRRPL